MVFRRRAAVAYNGGVPPPDWILLSLAFPVVFASAFTPGINNAVVMTIALNFGFRRTLPWTLGVGVGMPLLLLCIGMGLNEFLSRFSWAHGAVKIIGGCFLLYMACGIAFAGEEKTRPQPRIPGFWRGILTQWLNPKVWITSLSLVGGFVRPGSFYAADVVYLAVLLFVVSVAARFVWGFCGALIKRALQKPKTRRIFNGVMGAMLACLAAGIMLS